MMEVFDVTLKKGIDLPYYWFVDAKPETRDSDWFELKILCDTSNDKLYGVSPFSGRDLEPVEQFFDEDCLPKYRFDRYNLVFRIALNQERVLPDSFKDTADLIYQVDPKDKFSIIKNRFGPRHWGLSKKVMKKILKQCNSTNQK